MSKIERILFSYNAMDRNKQTFSLGNQSNIQYSLINKNVKMHMPLTPIIQPVPIKEIKSQQFYHTSAKYGASKYTSSLQSGKMHKLL